MATRRELVASVSEGLQKFVAGHNPAALAKHPGNRGFLMACNKYTPQQNLEASEEEEGKNDNLVEAHRAYIRAGFISMPSSLCLDLPQSLLTAQDQLLANELATDGVIECATLTKHAANVSVWQGDMSKLRCDAVVNPGNSALLGCFLPTHKCLDNILHAQSGPRLRIACHNMLQKLGINEDVNGQCRVTEAYALPSKYVFHTVGPCLLSGRGAPPRKPNKVDKEELRSCYSTCLDKCLEMNLSSIAFCCISTGIFGYPSEDATLVALAAVKTWQEAAKAKGVENLPHVIFNVFKDEDLALYQKWVPKVLPPAAAEAPSDEATATATAVAAEKKDE